MLLALSPVVRIVSPVLAPHLETANRVPPTVRLEHVSMAFDDVVVLRDISFTVPSGCMTVILGASGSGKSVILRLVLGLLTPDAGAIYVGSHRVDTMSEPQLMTMRRDIGMLFQEHALFDSLTVADNVGYHLYEAAAIPPGDIDRRVATILDRVGLADYALRFPSELSGGQRRRVAVARAMVGRPGLLLFDEPTSGLDPITARGVDDLIVTARDLQHSTTLLVTHQIRDAFYVTSRIAHAGDGAPVIVERPADDETGGDFLMLRDGRIYFEGSGAELRRTRDPYLKAFIS